MSGFPTSTTYRSLVDEIVSGLQGYTLAPDAMTVLTQPASNTDTVFTVEDASSISQGVIEIGRELVYVKSVSTTTSQINTNAAWRGFRGTLAEPHAVGETVTFKPSFPRAQVAREVNNILRGLYPLLFGVKALEPTVSTTQSQYELPAETVAVLDVRAWRDDAEGWFSLKAWDVQFSAPSDFSTGVVLSLFGIVDPAVKLQVLYAVPPGVLVNDSDDFVTTTGLPESCKEIVVAGVQYRMTQHIDPARLIGSAVQAESMNRQYQPGLAQQVASSFGKQYQEALVRERAALSAKYPARVHKVR